MRRARNVYEKPPGWFWYMAEDPGGRWGYLGSLDLRPTGHQFREWFLGLGNFVLTVGWCGKKVEA